MKNITIIGSGSFGCALAHTFSKNNNIKIWSYTKEETDSINIKHECLQLPSIKLKEDIICFQDYENALEDSDIIVLVCPSNTVRNTCKDIKKYYTNQDILVASKGLENDKVLSDIIKEELGVNASVITGPSFAEELGEDEPTHVELSGNKELVEYLQNDNFKIEYNEDIIGLQIGGALKNVVTLACGVVEGLGYKVNTTSYVFTEGLKEIKEIGIKMGAKESTFYGLSGLGDLYLTSLGNKSRNKRAGILIGQNNDLNAVYKEVGQTIEGLETVKDAKYLIDRYNINCPLIGNLYDIIYCKKDVKSIIN